MMKRRSLTASDSPIPEEGPLFVPRQEAIPAIFPALPAGNQTDSPESTSSGTINVTPARTGPNGAAIKKRWRPKEEREAAKRDREIRRKRREAKRTEHEERRKRREIKKGLRKELVANPREGVSIYNPKLKCRDCGGGMIVSMRRDPETGDNLPCCERCDPGPV